MTVSRRRALLLSLLSVCLVLLGSGPVLAEPTYGSSAPRARDSLRGALTDQNFYFVMQDRFANGTTANDAGGLTGDRLVTGFDPTAKGFYHGGDLIGLRKKLSYIKGLGTTAIWMTPSFKNKPVQGAGADLSAGYHGYWITDFTQIDPHLGSNQDLKDLIEAAHKRGMKVFFDIITNHTADVINYREGTYDYIPKSAGPYRDASGTPFDDRDYAGTKRFPKLDPAMSFPYTPFVPAAEATVKRPAWLNDPIHYHNRGNSTFSGENSLYGDFFGLDDLFTEQPAVVNGMIDIYKSWVRDFGIDGFRIDTVKHVNDEFWQQWTPAILNEAHRAGKQDFFMFGEVFDTSRPFTSHFTTDDRLQAVLDFPFQRAAQDFAAGSRPTNSLREFFVDDDWYTDADSNAYQLPTFLGNHDMGRIGLFIRQAQPGQGAGADLARDRLAHELMYFSRGNPVVYYGDEQGFVGDGGDQDARQDMFPSQVASYNDDDNIGTAATPAQDNFDPSHPLYAAIRQLAAVTARNRALRNGAMQVRSSEAGAGVFAFSRTDRRDQIEYVVALNNATTSKSAAIQTYSAKQRFTKVYGSGPSRLRTDTARTLAVNVPALSAVVYRADDRVARSKAAPKISVTAADDATVSGRLPVTANVAGTGVNQVTFYQRTSGQRGWRLLGTDDNAPYRVFPSVADVSAGTAVQFQAVVEDNAGHQARATATGTVPEPPAPVTTAVVHYNRPDGNYDSWGLHLWGDAIDVAAGTDWAAPRPPDEIDSTGAVFRIPLADGTQPLNFIVHTPAGDTVPTTREPGGDRSFVPAEHPEIWLQANDPQIHFAPTGLP
jgi:alpha-amylase